MIMRKRFSRKEGFAGQIGVRSAEFVQKEGFAGQI
jgi:hypothetical protein